MKKTLSQRKISYYLWGTLACFIGATIFLGLLTGRINEETIPHMLGGHSKREGRVVRQLAQFTTLVRNRIGWYAAMEKNDPTLIPEVDAISEWLDPDIYGIIEFGSPDRRRDIQRIKSNFSYLTQGDPWGNQIHFELTYSSPSIVVDYSDNSSATVTSPKEIERGNGKKIRQIIEGRDYTIKVWSEGANGINENGKGDDLVVQRSVYAVFYFVK